MMSYIFWNPELTAIQLGPLGIRWYSLCWIIGLLAAYFYVRRIFSDEKIPYEKFEPLYLYCFIGILIGARLGHCVFYQPEYFLASAKGWFEMFIPVKLFGAGVADSLSSGQWKFIGYEGLASHGGTLGLMLALLLYSRKMKLPLLFLIDAIAIATPVTACFIRLGNLMNSEIIGKPTTLPWAFVFERVDNIPRHPGQLYEAIAYCILALIMFAIYKRTSKGKKAEKVRTDFRNITGNKARNDFKASHDNKAVSGNKTLNDSTRDTKNEEKNQMSFCNRYIGTGFYFGLCLLFIFTARFFIELTKENQVDFESAMTINMGQLLSLPFVVLGAVCMWRGYKKK